MIVLLTVAALIIASAYDIMNRMEIPLWVFPSLYFADFVYYIYSVEAHGGRTSFTDIAPAICVMLTVVIVKAIYKERCFGGADAMALVAIAIAFGYDDIYIFGIFALMNGAYYLYRRIKGMCGAYPLIPILTTATILYCLFTVCRQSC